jgi:hypothetical protein
MDFIVSSSGVTQVAPDATCLICDRLPADGEPVYAVNLTGESRPVHDGACRDKLVADLRSALGES